MPPLEIGDHISYVLLPKDLPTNPDRLWHGEIISVGCCGVQVRSTETGYEGLDEWILFAQIREQKGEQNRWISVDFIGQ